ncbi:MAG: efflux RND transporter permease subunit [Planctomycetota bacterium]|nr:MAG: efflux RND transporter permease subunit [Planctomycetota bacterium]
MSLARFSLARPVTTVMATLIAVLIGSVALVRLPIDLLPDVTMPSITVVTNFDNASPEEVEQQVTELVEGALAALPGVESMVSTSSEGVSSVRLAFTWGTNLDAATNDVRDRIDRIRRRLPTEADLPQPRKYDQANFPIVLLGVSSQLDPIELTQLIEDRLIPRLGRIDGVAQVDVWGGFNREIQVRLDRGRMNAVNLSLDGIVDTIRSANINLPAGSVERDRLEVTIRAPGEFRDIEELRQTVLTRHHGSPVLLADITEVVDTHRRITRIVRINGEAGVRLAVRKQSDVNTVAVAEQVMAEIERINADMPQADVRALFNQAAFIRRSIDNVVRSVILGGALAIVVLLFFLRHVRSTVVMGLSIPISVIATFALVHFAGFSLNLMTLGGLALGVGMMVDNSIVVLENIFRRRRELGEAPPEAAVAGAGEVATAILASTITTLVIFLPLVFARGVSSILFQQLAAVITFALICSLIVSLTLVPMLSATMLKDRKSWGPAWVHRLAAFAESAFNAVDSAYRDLLQLVLRHRLLTVLGAFALLLSVLPLVRGIGTEFMPPSDEGEIRVNGEMEVGTRLAVLDRQTRQLEELIRNHVPELENMSVSAGPSGWRPSSSAEASIQLSVGPAAGRSRSNTEIAADLRRHLDGQIPGMTIRVRAPQGLRILNRLVGTGDEGLAVEIFGFDPVVLDDLAVAVAAAMEGVPGVTDVLASREVGVPQELIRIDRARAADLGLSIRQIASTLETAVAGSNAGDFREGGNAYRILVRLDDADRLSVDELLDLRMGANQQQEGVPLRTVVSVERSTGPMLIERKDQQRFVSVAANVSGRDLGSIAADVQAVLNEIPLPAGYSMQVAGDFEEQQSAFRELMIALVLSLCLVYMVLASQYESLRDPLVVMFSVPLAAIGVILTLFLTGTTFNVQSYIGCIMLGGIVVNNAILLVDQAGRLRREGLEISAAVAEAGRRRLRPILMTTATTMLGLLPLALGMGEGAEAQAPLARAVIGGLATSTLITLVLIPALYALVHQRDKTTSPASAA